jgi:hypothetical protein
LPQFADGFDLQAQCWRAWRGVYQTVAGHGVMRPIHHLIGAALLWSICSLGSASAESPSAADTPDPVEAKAAHILGFLRYTQWPVERNAEQREVLVIGSRSLFSALRRQSRSGAKLGYPPVLVRRADPDHNSLENLIRRSQAAHAVFIAADSIEDFSRLLTELSGKPVLTIGDSSDFTEAGGMLKLVAEETQLRFVVNTMAIEASRLQVSAKALKLARSQELPL